MQSKNPILKTMEEALLLYGTDVTLAAIVSIGTGKSQGLEPGTHLLGIIKSLAARTTNTEGKHNEFLRRFENLNDRYFRFQEPGDLGEIDLAASEKLSDVERLAEEYLISEEGRNAIVSCARKLHDAS